MSLGKELSFFLRQLQGIQVGKLLGNHPSDLCREFLWVSDVFPRQFGEWQDSLEEELAGPWLGQLVLLQSGKLETKT